MLTTILRSPRGRLSSTLGSSFRHPASLDYVSDVTDEYWRTYRMCSKRCFYIGADMLQNVVGVSCSVVCSTQNAEQSLLIWNIFTYLFKQVKVHAECSYSNRFLTCPHTASAWFVWCPQNTSEREFWHGRGIFNSLTCEKVIGLLLVL